jgi:hypothetical protein
MSLLPKHIAIPLQKTHHTINAEMKHLATEKIFRMWCRAFSGNFTWGGHI